MDNYNNILNQYSSDKGTAPIGKEESANGYGDLYEKYFIDFKNSAKNICDIGIDKGESLLANREYFINANIHGVDIADKSIFQSERVFTHIVDQSREIDLDSFTRKMEESGVYFDIIIDDGSHDVSHQQMTFGKFFNLLRPGGLYIIEDMGTSFFVEGENLYGYTQTREKIENNTIKFLTQRPLKSPWIQENILKEIDSEVDSIIILDKVNRNLPYSMVFSCENNYQIRSITSIIRKND